jgi:hypothetical protein
MSALLSQLMRFSLGTEAWHATPFSITINKTIWSVATDGFVMLAVKLPGATLSKGYPEELPGMLSNPPINPIEIDLVRLKEWAGPASIMLVPNGEVGYKDQGMLLDSPIDRRKLAYIFSRITVPTVRAWVAKPGILLGFESIQGNWRAFLACLKSGYKGIPVFQVKLTEVPLSAFELSELVEKEESKNRLPAAV